MRQHQSSCFVVAALVTLAGTARVALAGPGAQDLGFASGGTAIAGSDVANEVWNDVRVQPDGKILVAGANANFYLARYLSSGVADTSFGSAGFVTLSRSSAKSIAVQPDGKILVAGDDALTSITAAGNLITQPAGLSTDVEIARFNANGTLDTTFGTGGVVRTDLSGGRVDSVSKLLLLPDGRVLALGATGTARGTTLTDWSIIAYKSNGAIDTAFGNAGRVVIGFNQAAGSASALDGVIQASTVPVTGAGVNVRTQQLSVQSLGVSSLAGVAGNDALVSASPIKVVIAGTSGPAMVAVRIDATTGAIDTTFANAGVAVVPIPFATLAARATSITTQTDGTLLLVGDGTFFDSDAGDVSAQLLAGTRLTAGGQLDAAFNAFPNAQYYAPKPTVIVANGKPIISIGGIRLVRLNSNGSIDTTLGDAGIFTPSTNPSGFLTNLALQSDGRVLMAGNIYRNLQSDAGMIRIDPDSSTNGPLLPPSPATDLAAVAVAAGSVGLAWTDRSANETSFAVERSLSSTFSNPLRLAVLVPNSTSFTDATVSPRTTYFYRVIAANASGSSASGVLRVTTPRR